MSKNLNYDFLRVHQYWWRSPRRRRYNPYEPEATLYRIYNTWTLEHWTAKFRRVDSISLDVFQASGLAERWTEWPLGRSGCERSEFPDKILYLAPQADCQVAPAAQPDLQLCCGQAESHTKFHARASKVSLLWNFTKPNIEPQFATSSAESNTEGWTRFSKFF
jgi:hypothetical protein